MVKNFKEFITENIDDIKSGEYVANYVEHITPNEDDIPHHFIGIISKHTFKLEQVRIDSLLLSDPDFKAYYDLYDEDDTRYTKYDIEDGIISEEDIHNPIVVVDGEVLDGYNRATELGYRGQEKIDAYINIKINENK